MTPVGVLLFWAVTVSLLLVWLRVASLLSYWRRDRRNLRRRV